ncbi:MAG: DUF2480 family protein [Balneolia bacterium]|nr:DUF2480 family protein [Balneolia bacterium]
MIENKVAKSGLVTIDLEQFRERTEVVSFDLKDYLFMELILKEKDFREALENLNWSQFENKVIAVHCSTDAIIAHWAYMLVAAHANGFAKKVATGTPDEVKLRLMLENMRSHDWKQYDDKRVLLKGCSDEEMNPAVYAAATEELIPYATRLMYGEACSFVPVYRKKSPKPVSS